MMYILLVLKQMLRAINWDIVGPLIMVAVGQLRGLYAIKVNIILY